MKKNNGERTTIKPKGAGLVRASISFPPNLYKTLEEIAKEKKVSLAWVVRDAAEKYIADKPAERGKSRADAR
jgi:metal-responsive CopG/Arc/MetJ family transcriptional regulator